MYDLVILGGGPAGVSAGVYAARKKLKTLLITQEFGGQTVKSSEVENYLGFTKISGVELVTKFHEHLDAIGAEVKTAEVEMLSKQDKIFDRHLPHTLSNAHHSHFIMLNYKNKKTELPSSVARLS